MPAITLPLRISFENWSKQVIRDLPQLLVPTIDPEDKKWKEWARLFMQINFLDVPCPADTLYPGEDGWRQWALLCLPTLENL